MHVCTQHLIARSERGLAETRQAAEAVAAGSRSSGAGAGLRVWTWPIDLGDLDALPARLDAVMAATGAGYERAYLFNNAGLVGPIAYAQVRL